MSEDTIVCTGRRIQNENGEGQLTFSRGTGTPTTSFPAQREINRDGEAPVDTITVVAVRIKKTKQSSDINRMESAARALITTIVRIMDALNRSEPLRQVVVKGRVFTVAQLIETLSNTEFEVTDETNFNNLGVGSARSGVDGGRNVDSINYDAILNNYHNPNFTGDPGLTALVLHELAHLSDAGVEFLGRSRIVFANDPTMAGVSSIYGTAYGNNLEHFANDVATAMADQIGLQLHGSRPGGYAAPAQSPEEVYETNNGQPYPG